MKKEIFRYTPHRAADAMKIIVGNKTNATIRDLEETEEDVEELEGIVVSIDKDKINGDGWTVKGSDGQTYVCNCSSNMYQLPETEEYGGVYYPTETVKVKITKNPILRSNSITEFTSLGKNETTLDLSKWKHGDKETTIIAKPKSAISISNGLISFNYDNTNEVQADKDAIKTTGKKTIIGTNSLNINSGDITIHDTELDDYIRQQALYATNRQNISNNPYDLGIDIDNQNNLSQLHLKLSTYIPKGKQKIITDLKNPALFPERIQKQPLLTGSDIDEVYIYPNGLVTVEARGVPNDKEIFTTLNWITPQYTRKSIITVQVKTACECCDETKTGEAEYFNYCPECKTWNTLSEGYDGYITCSSCHLKWCAGCGHLKDIECGNKSKNLKEYSMNNIVMTTGTSCSYCKDHIPTGQVREYANYCPRCHEWGYLRLDKEYSEDEENTVIHCDHCDTSYCTNCTIMQGDKFISSFLSKDYYYKDFIEKYPKLTHIRDD